VDEDLRDVIVELFRRRAEGAGINALCLWLVSEGVRSPSGGKGWVHSALSPILASRRYLGEFKFGEQSFTDSSLAIVTEAEWQAAQLKKGGVVPKTGKTSDAALLRGIARCAGCGRTLKILYTRRQGNRLRYYCKNPSAKGPCPSRALVRLEVLDSFVEAWFLDAIKDDVRVAGAVAARERAAETQRAVEETERELAAFVTAASALDANLFRMGVEERQRKVDLAKSDHALALSEARTFGDVPSGDLVASWPGLSMDHKRRLLGAFVDAVNVSKGRGEIADRVQFVRDGVVIPHAKERGGSFQNDRTATRS
jgi:Recombinase/Recombinase zinc beta ribbon domain